MSVLAAIPVDRITVQARQIRFGRTMLTLLAGVLFAIGWCLAKSFAVAWLALSWCAIAVQVGWVEGLGGARDGGDG
jgi:hypothetical protein